METFENCFARVNGRYLSDFLWSAASSDTADTPIRVEHISSQIQDVVDGLEYLHSRDPPICHGDLKSVSGS